MKLSVPFVLRAILPTVLAAFSLQAWGLDCVPANIELTNQAEIGSFSTTKCTKVTGNLVIGGIRITSLEGLSNLTSMAKGLSISNNAALTSIEGLSNFTSLGWGFVYQLQQGSH